MPFFGQQKNVDKRGWVSYVVARHSPLLSFNQIKAPTTLLSKFLLGDNCRLCFAYPPTSHESFHLREFNIRSYFLTITTESTESSFVSPHVAGDQKGLNKKILKRDAFGERAHPCGLIVTTNPLQHFKKCHLLFLFQRFREIHHDEKNTHTHSQQTKHYTWQQGAGFIFSVNNLENVHVSTMAASPYYHKMERETNSFGKLKVGKENKSTRVLFCLNGSSLCIVIHALNDNTKPAINSPPHA